MNLSRPEQYFAEFLSALEKNDPRDRLISLSESQLPNAPALLVEGRRIRVPHNVWFVGTANHDETTNEFADKTYDRAHVMTLPRHEAGFKIEPKPKASFSYASLMERFDAAATQNADEVGELLAS
jgi:5-methylcytosine-specific restriction endonuclease McrBC GTP-binding regulatory subunit McrB